MSADVLCTLDGRDLDPTDVLVDTEIERRLISQQVDTILSIAEGEWPTNIFAGIDWLGYMTERRVNMAALTSEISRTIEEVPNVVVSSITGSQTGRVVNITVEGSLSQNPFRATLVVNPETRPRVGDNSLYVPFSIHWGSSGIR